MRGLREDAHAGVVHLHSGVSTHTSLVTATSPLTAHLKHVCSEVLSKVLAFPVMAMHVPFLAGPMGCQVRAHGVLWMLE